MSRWANALRSVIARLSAPPHEGLFSELCMTPVRPLRAYLTLLCVPNVVDVFADYWHECPHYVVEEFHYLTFPFEPIEVPRFRTDMSWAMENLLDYFETWSSSVKDRQTMRTHPTELIGGKLATTWGEPEQRHDLHIPLYTRIGRV